jgi:hypothetical protein
MAYPNDIEPQLPSTSPTSLRTWHSAWHNSIASIIFALQTKVWADWSSINTSIDYLLKNPLSTDPWHKHSIGAISWLSDALNEKADASAVSNALWFKADKSTTINWQSLNSNVVLNTDNIFLLPLFYFHLSE